MGIIIFNPLFLLKRVLKYWATVCRGLGYQTFEQTKLIEFQLRLMHLAVLLNYEKLFHFNKCLHMLAT